MEKSNEELLSELKEAVKVAYKPVKERIQDYAVNNKAVFSDRQAKARGISYGIMKSMDYDSPEMFTLDDVFVVWFSKTLQNWKALVSASYKGAPYIEITHNGDKKETYFDVYRKIENIVIPD